VRKYSDFRISFIFSTLDSSLRSEKCISALAPAGLNSVIITTAAAAAALVSLLSAPLSAWLCRPRALPLDLWPISGLVAVAPGSRAPSKLVRQPGGNDTVLQYGCRTARSLAGCSCAARCMARLPRAPFLGPWRVVATALAYQIAALAGVAFAAHLEAASGVETGGAGIHMLACRLAGVAATVALAASTRRSSIAGEHRASSPEHAELQAEKRVGIGQAGPGAWSTRRPAARDGREQHGSRERVGGKFFFEKVRKYTSLNAEMSLTWRK
jgi:hypothetical protein